MAATCKDQPLDFRPGTRWAYSNSGYQLLGYIVEKITGEPYPEYIERTLLARAGMERSLWGNDMRVVPNRAAPYLYVKSRIENAVNPNVQVAWAAGALQGTAEDFLKWQRALLAQTFITRATLTTAWTPAPLEDGTLSDYGYGWFIGEFDGRPLVEHGGNMGGFMTHAIYLQQEDLLVVAFMNSRGKRLPGLVATDLLAVALGKPLNLAPVTLPTDLLRSYTGVYRDAEAGDVFIRLENGELFYQVFNHYTFAIPRGRQ